MLWRLAVSDVQTAGVQHENEILPDDKDWTWVLERPCPECGFEAEHTAATSVASMIRINAGEFAELLAGDLGGDADALRERRRAGRWSTLEYAAHVRDVYRLYFERLNMMLEQDDPLYPNWDQDQTAIEQEYNAQDPTAVAAELIAAGATLADAFDRVEGDQWQRNGRRSDGASFTVDSFSRYLIHDPVHHLWDVRAG